MSSTGYWVDRYVGLELKRETVLSHKEDSWSQLGRLHRTDHGLWNLHIKNQLEEDELAKEIENKTREEQTWHAQWFWSRESQGERTFMEEGEFFFEGK